MDDLLDFGTFDPERERWLFGPLPYQPHQPSLPKSDPRRADKQSVRHPAARISPGILIARRNDPV